MSFAVLRNTHEAFRNEIQTMNNVLMEGNVEMFVEKWRAYHRALKVHMAMEDNGLFVVMAQVYQKKDNTLPKEHDQDKAKVAAIDKLLKAKAVDLAGRNLVSLSLF
jgi:hemerythrin-like domain-containing protein